MEALHLQLHRVYTIVQKFLTVVPWMQLLQSSVLSRKACHCSPSSPHFLLLSAVFNFLHFFGLQRRKVTRIKNEQTQIFRGNHAVVCVCHLVVPVSTLIFS